MTGGFICAPLLDLMAQGESLSLLERAVLLYNTACPDTDPAVAWDVPVGDRDRAIWQAWRQDQGAILEAISACPKCGEAVEFALPDDFTPPAAKRTQAMLNVDGRDFTLRFPTSRDLYAAQQGAFKPGDLIVDDDGTPELTEEAIEAALEAGDPGLDMVITHTCPACAAVWGQSFDVIRFVWQDCVQRAEKLLRDIDVIARAYTWSETEILTLSEDRRGRYVAMTRGQFTGSVQGGQGSP
jgi:hypothetical protein